MLTALAEEPLTEWHPPEDTLLNAQPALIEAGGTSSASAEIPREPLLPPIPEEPTVVTNGQQPPPSELAWRIYPGLTMGTSYDDNLFIDHEDPKSDFAYLLAPSLTFGWGNFQNAIAQLGSMQSRLLVPDRNFSDPRNYLFAQYTSMARYFSDHTEANGADHDFLMSGQAAWARFRFNAEAHVQYLTDTDIDFGDRVDRLLATANFVGSYAWDDHFSATAGVRYAYRDYERGVTSDDWSVPLFVEYRNGPENNTIGVGVLAGRLEAGEALVQNYEQALIHARWVPAARLTFTGEGGVEFRQTETGLPGDQVNAVWRIGASYSPTDSLQIGVETGRQVTSSASLTEENIVGTSLDLAVRQRIYGRLYLTLRAGYLENDYSGGEGDGSRLDKRWYLRPGFTLMISQYFAIDLDFLHEENISSEEFLSFERNVTNLRFTFSF